jgi:hypothetical protein
MYMHIAPYMVYMYVLLPKVFGERADWVRVEDGLVCGQGSEGLEYSLHSWSSRLYLLR